MLVAGGCDCITCMTLLVLTGEVLRLDSCMAQLAVDMIMSLRATHDESFRLDWAARKRQLG